MLNPRLSHSPRNTTVSTSGKLSGASFDSRASTVRAGHFPEFDSAKGSLSLWFWRQQFFFVAHDIDAPEWKEAHCLSLCDEQTYETACSDIHPKTPATVWYDEPVAALTADFDPVHSEVYNRTLFQLRDLLPGESLNANTAALQKQVTNCGFGTPHPTARLYDNYTMLTLDVMLRADSCASSVMRISNSVSSQSRTFLSTRGQATARPEIPGQ